MDFISRHSDGGAALRLTNIELVGFYNLMNEFLRASTPQELEWAENQGQIEQVATLAN